MDTPPHQESHEPTLPDHDIEGTAGGMDPLYAALGPFYDTDGAMHWLRVDADELEVRRAEQSVLAMRTGSGDWLYPAWQFSPDAGLHPELVSVLAALRGLDGWLASIWLVNEHIDLDGLSPRQALAAGADPGWIAVLARRDVATLRR